MKPSLINYSRISSVRQTSGTGLAQQQSTEVMNQLSEHYKLPIDSRVFADVGKSAFKGNHLENDLGRLLALIEDGSVVSGSVLVVFSLDRLSRQHLTSAVSLLLNIISQGVGVHTTIDNRLYTNDSDTLMADLMMSLIAFAVANEESLKKSKRTVGAGVQRITDFTEGKLTPSNKVRWIGIGRLPLWCSLDEHKGIVTNKYLTDMLKIIELSLTGYGALYVAQELNQVSDYNWDSSKVTKVLARKSLTGTYQVKLADTEYTLTDYFPAVCSEDEYYRIRQIKEQKARRRGTANFLPLLVGNGIFKHYQCGGGVRVNRSKLTKQVSYSCLTRCKGSDCVGFNGKAIDIEKNVYHVIYDLLFSAAQAVQVVSPIPRIEEAMNTKQNQLQELLALFDSGELPTSLISRIKPLEDELTDLTEQLTEARTSAPVTDLIDRWELITTACLESAEHSEERVSLRQLIADTCESITIDKETKRKDYSLIIQLRDGRTRCAYVTSEGELVREPNEHELDNVTRFRLKTLLATLPTLSATN